MNDVEWSVKLSIEEVFIHYYPAMSKRYLLPCLALSALSLYTSPVAARVSSHGFHHEEADARTVNQSTLPRKLPLSSVRRYRMFKDGILSRVGDAAYEDSTVGPDGENMPDSEAKELGQWFMEHGPDDERLGEWFKENLFLDNDAISEAETVGVGGRDEADEEIEDEVAEEEQKIEITANGEDVNLYDDPDCIETETAPRIIKTLRGRRRRRNLGGKSGGGKASKSADAYQLFHAHILPYQEVTTTTSTVTTSTVSPIITSTTFPAVEESNEGEYYYLVTDDDYGGKSAKSDSKSSKSKAGKGSKSGDISTEIPVSGAPSVAIITGTPTVRCTKSPTLRPSSAVHTAAPSEIANTKVNSQVPFLIGCPF